MNSKTIHDIQLHNPMCPERGPFRLKGSKWSGFYDLLLRF